MPMSHGKTPTYEEEEAEYEALGQRRDRNAKRQQQRELNDAFRAFALRISQLAIGFGKPRDALILLEVFRSLDSLIDLYWSRDEGSAGSAAARAIRAHVGLRCLEMTLPLKQPQHGFFSGDWTRCASTVRRLSISACASSDLWRFLSNFSNLEGLLLDLSAPTESLGRQERSIALSRFFYLTYLRLAGPHVKSSRSSPSSQPRHSSMSVSPSTIASISSQATRYLRP